MELAKTKVADLYKRRMQLWRGTGHRTSTLADEMARRLKHRDEMPVMLQSLGQDAVSRSLEQYSLPGLEIIQNIVDSILASDYDLPTGLIHGDLHSQNILVDDRDELHLIDFAWAGYGWPALDFLMLECSLKFPVVPNDAGVAELLQMERVLDQPTRPLRLGEAAPPCGGSANRLLTKFPFYA
jgi:serine/threonine protein kinase